MNNHFKDLLYSNSLINTTRGMVPINVTSHPSKFPVDKVVQAQELQTIINTLFYKLMKDEATFQRDTKDEMYNLLLKMRRSSKKKKPTLIYMRTDYLLNKDNILKQVEFNTIAVSFIDLNTRLNHVHSLLYGNVWQPNNIGCFAEMVSSVHRLFAKMGQQDAIALLIDDKTGLDTFNFFDKKNIIHELKKTGITMLHVTMSDIEESGEFMNGQFMFNKKTVFFVYYRFFYNFNQHDHKAIDLRKKIEESDAITLPSIELQIVGLKMFQIVLKDKHYLARYLPPEHIERIYSHFGDFKSIADYQDGDEQTYFLKCMNEGGNTLITEGFRAYQDRTDSYFLMKKIEPMVVKNRFYTDETDSDMVLELGILGMLIEHEGSILCNKHAGFICRTKRKETNECGVTCNYGGLDTIYKE